MGEVEAKGDGVERHALRHDRHTVSMLTDHLVFSPKYRGKVLLGEEGEAAEENLSLEKKTLPKKHEWEVVEKYISGQKVSYSYEKTDAVPIVVIDEEEEEYFAKLKWRNHEKIEDYRDSCVSRCFIWSYGNVNWMLGPGGR